MKDRDCIYRTLESINFDRNDNITIHMPITRLVCKAWNSFPKKVQINNFTVNMTIPEGVVSVVISFTSIKTNTGKLTYHVTEERETFIGLTTNVVFPLHSLSFPRSVNTIVVETLPTTTAISLRLPDTLKSLRFFTNTPTAISCIPTTLETLGLHPRGYIFSDTNRLRDFMSLEISLCNKSIMDIYLLNLLQIDHIPVLNNVRTAIGLSLDAVEKLICKIPHVTRLEYYSTRGDIGQGSMVDITRVMSHIPMSVKDLCSPVFPKTDKTRITKYRGPVEGEMPNVVDLTAVSYPYRFPINMGFCSILHYRGMIDLKLLRHMRPLSLDIDLIASNSTFSIDDVDGIEIGLARLEELRITSMAITQIHRSSSVSNEWPRTPKLKKLVCGSCMSHPGMYGNHNIQTPQDLWSHNPSEGYTWDWEYLKINDNVSIDILRPRYISTTSVGCMNVEDLEEDLQQIYNMYDELDM